MKEIRNAVDETRALRADLRALREASSGAASPAAPKSDRLKLGSSRGVETMYRSAYRVHMNLTTLADTKANILVSINAAIIPLVLVAVTRIGDAPILLVPLTTLLATCLGSMIFAILGARPRIAYPRVRTADFCSGRASLLFFGSYTQLDEDAYVDAMSRLTVDRNAVYEAMMRNLYGIGQILTRKFEMLNRAYTIFMVGLVGSIVLAFVFLAATALG